ncbi:YigZ family protein [Companilactobacillus sp. RD055328]|uniref:YigZ family protein n=1 Tax=Companilactobacillus sp. RD055328 TaxID=2916634 RepID=UPI001FC86C5C|nr:YigZ family protein [Companilactobacillus sp. RD055328]GKQ43062.1 YigZ family protein [Companilactobacillus sp. RD055328]
MSEYFSIKNNLINEVEIKKSRFITNLIKVESEEDAIRQLSIIKKEHYKANHNCSAYIIGANSNIKRMSDDGEPAGTAGNPILSVLEEKQLTNVLAVVTRYFGGIKLGKGGLIRAYSNSVSSLLTSDQIVEGVLLQRMEFVVPYNLFDQIKYSLEQMNIELSNIQYKEQITFDVWLSKSEIPNFKDDIKNQFNNVVIINELETEIREIPIKKD